MKRSIATWAALCFFCFALMATPEVIAQLSSRKFIRVTPASEADKIAARNAAGALLYQAQGRQWRTYRNSAAATQTAAKTETKDEDFEQSEQFLVDLQGGNSSVTPSVKSETTTASNNFGGFIAAPSYQIMTPPVSSGWLIATATADLNRDGYPDLINVDTKGKLYILLNDGKGGFQTPVINSGASVLSSPNPVYITTGDVNGDGLIDIIVTDYASSSVLVYINQGNGVFSTPTVVTPTLASGAQLGAILLSDRNGDGYQDLVVVSYLQITTATGYSTNIAIQTLYGNGSGGFTVANAPETDYVYSGYSVIIPNGGAQLAKLGSAENLVIEAEAYDSNLFSTGTSVIAFPAKSSGLFSTTPSTEVDFASNYYYALSYANGLSLADINGDGYPDITLTFGDYYLYGALGRSDGTFADPALIENGNLEFEPSGWAVADVNGDGYPDMIDMEQFYTAIWLGRGDGTFADPKVLYSSPAANTANGGSEPGNNLVAADFNQDGKMDFASSDAVNTTYYGRASVYIGHGDGTFHAAAAFAPLTGDPVPEEIDPPKIIDLNGDGFSDVVAVNLSASPYSLLSGVNDGKGNFTYYTALGGGENGFKLSSIVGVGDFNGDGYQDVLLIGKATSSSKYYRLAVALSTGKGLFTNPTMLNMGSYNFTTLPQVLVGDVNNDGALDIVFTYPGTTTSAASGYWVALGNGDGTFQTPTYTAFGSKLNIAALADVNNDGYKDLIVFDASSKSSYTTYIIPGTAAGTFPTSGATALMSSVYPVKIVPADVNTDGKIDLVISVQGTFSGTTLKTANAGVRIYAGNGDGTFTLASTAQSGKYYAVDLVVADFNGDGYPDLFTSQYSPVYATSTFYSGNVLLGNGDGTFQDPVSLLMPPASTSLAAAKLTADGTNSIIGYSYYGPVFILYNQGGTSLNLATSENSITIGQTVSLTASVTATMPYRPVPEGTVSFYDNGTLLGTETLSAGTASISASSLGIGSHAITATYSGDADFNMQSNSSQVNVTVAAAATVTPEISLTAKSTSLSLSAGGSGAVSLVVSSNSAYSGTVVITASGAQDGLSVSISPATVVLSGGSSASITASVSTLRSAATAAARPISPGWLAGFASTGGIAMGLLLFGLPQRKKKYRRLWVALILFSGLASCAALSACDSTSKFARSGTYTIVVTATPSVSGVSVQVASFNVTVQ